MSSIASISLIHSAALAPLQRAATPTRSLFGGRKDAFWAVLSRERVGSIEFPGSGYILGTLLPYLEEKHAIDLMTCSDFDAVASCISEAREIACFVLGPEHLKWLPGLAPKGFSEDALGAYYNAFNETNEEHAGKMMLEGIRFLHPGVAALSGGLLGLLLVA